MWKVILPVILLLIAGGTGYYYGSQKPPVTIEKIVTRTEIVEKIVTKSVERKPDGTVIETTKEEDRHEAIKQEQGTTTKGGSGYASPDYRIGLRYWASSSDPVLEPRWNNIGVSLGRRIVGPVWADFEFKQKETKKEFALGFSVQF